MKNDLLDNENFHTFLAEVLKDGPFSVQEWAEILDLDLEVLNKLFYFQVPSAQTLICFFETIMEIEGFSEELRFKMKTIFSKPIHFVLKKRVPNMGLTLNHYMERLKTKDFFDLILALLPEKQQEFRERNQSWIREALLR